MRPRRILAIDQGSSSSKALVVDEAGRAIARASRPLATRFPRAGWVEQNPQEIWRSVVDAAADSLAAAGPSEIVAIGISNQRESAVAWDRRTGEPLGPCVTWQCRRSGPLCDDLRNARQQARVEELTGLALDPMFSAGKMRWLLDSVPDGHARAARGEICLGTVDSWLVWKMTQGRVHATDASNASRTQLFDIARGAWSAELARAFGVPVQGLPEIRASDGHFGEAEASDFPCQAPIHGVAGDSHAAMFAHAAFEPGTVKATFGTGSSLMALATHTPAGAAAGLSSAVAWQLGERITRALEGNIASTGATLEWVGRLLGEDEDAGARAADLAMQAPDSDEVYFVPAFAGLGAPHWDDQARGLICGLTRGSTAVQIARAALESIAFQVADVFDALDGAAAGSLSELRADGGASRNDLLMQFQADVLRHPVVRDRSLDLSAFGAAYLAGLGAGVWDLAAIGALPRETDRFEPRMSAAEAARLRKGWWMAIARTKLRASPGGLSA